MTKFEDAVATEFLQRVTKLSKVLRGCGVDVSLSENLEAIKSLQYLDIGNRGILFRCLQAVMIKRAQDLSIFEEIFDQIFTDDVSETAMADRRSAGRSSDESTTGDDALRLPGDAAAANSLTEKLLSAISGTGNDDVLKLLAFDAVNEFASFDGAKSSERYYLYRVMRAIDIGNLLIAAMRAARATHPEATDFELRIMRDGFNERLERYRELLAREIRSRLRKVDLRLGGGLGGGLVAPRRIEELDFLGAGHAEMREMRDVIRPLARRLASKIGHRRRIHSFGRLDMRRTTRRSIQFGGVPFQTMFKRRRPQRTQVVVLCDISGSVAEFAHFTLMLLHAMQNELFGLRSFVFVDGIAEVTSLVKNADVNLDPRLLVTLPGVVVNDGHSDYLRALTTFTRNFNDALTPATTLIITGDARTNYTASGESVLGEIARQVKSVYWFNPESTAIWSSADSAIESYRAHCDGVYEVRNLSQLADAINDIV